jgi:serine/threonine-protein kinase
MAARERIEIDIEEPPTPSPTEAPVAEQRLGRYVLVHEVATGGMATVHLAIPDGARGPDDVVALKRVHPHLATQRSFIEMFLDEARIASRLDHPNVCRVLDYGRASNTYFLTMRYLRGRSLSQVARALRKLPEAEHDVAAPILAARLVADAALGLHAAHELCDEDGAPLEVVHRDVSPHNLFVGWDGAVQVVDFGIASARNRLHHTETGTVKGKFAYMAPEQMLGARVDRRADVWSLGVVLWEIVAGRTLFKRRTESETVMAVTRLELPALATLRPGSPSRLDEIVARALAREPEDRYPTAAALAEDLHAWLDEQPGPADAAEVAAWMQRLFPDEAEREEQLVRRAYYETLPTFDEPSFPERSAIVRRSRPPSPAAARPMASLGLYLLALALAVAVGAVAALWPRGDRDTSTHRPTIASEAQGR